MNIYYMLIEGRGGYAHFTATAFEMTVGGLSLPFISDQFVPMLTEHAGSCDMFTCFVSRHLAVTSSS